LKEFRNILFGQQIVIHTDHCNILYNILSSDRFIRWRLLLEEYGPEYVHVSGKDNIVADALSRMEVTFNTDKKEIINDNNDCAQLCAYVISQMIHHESYESDEEEVDPFVSAEWLTSAESVTLPDPILENFFEEYI
jgi:hypothetical protein